MLAPFRRLQWKLTFSYTLVTVGTLVVIELILIIAALVFFASGILATLLVGSLRTEVAAEAAVYLEQTPPDISGLQTWLDSLVNTQTNVSFSGVSETTTLDTGNLNIEGSEQQILILDTELNLLGWAGTESATDEVPFDIDSIPGAAEPIANALQGETENEKLYSRSPDGSLVVALPILAQDDTVVGVMILYLVLPNFNSVILWPILSTVLVTVIPLTIGAGLIGTLFGFLTARGLSRRLRVLSTAADAWSQGDFSPVAPDESGDEIGQLSRRLNRMAEQLQNLLDTRQELAMVEERNRLARDLHDSVKQQVFASVMQLGAARALIDTDPQAAKAHLAEAEQLTRQSQLELAGLIQELRPAALDDKGLVEALRSYVTDWSRRTDIEATLRVQGEQPIPLLVEQALFRVAQEALSNIARHSQAQTADLHLAWEDGDVILTISDDGQGFDVAAAAKHGLGTQSMQERIEALNGRLTVESEPGKGSQVKAIIIGIRD